MPERKGYLSSEYCVETGQPKGALSWLTHIMIFSLMAVFFLTFYTPSALAAAGPHGGFGSGTEKCERCHSIHTAKTQKLMQKDTILELCVSCHSKGIGADTAVMDGALLRPVEPGSSTFDNLGTLLGGGFDSIGATGSTTSRHMVGVISAPSGGDANKHYGILDCVSCHTPHEGPNYRMLRRRPNEVEEDIEVGWNKPDDIVTIDEDGETVTTPDPAYEERVYGAGVTFDSVTGTFGGASREVTRNYNGGISAWCSGCHSSYMTRHDTVPFDAGDSEGLAIRYRHAVDLPIIGRTNLFNPSTTYNLATDLPLNDINANGRDDADTVSCLTCHKAHGSSAVMTGETVLAGAGDRGTLPQGDDSMLLRLDDRQVCQTACHKVVSP